MENSEKKEKRMEIKLPHSLYSKLLNEQLKVYQKTKKKVSIGYLIRQAIRKVYK